MEVVKEEPEDVCSLPDVEFTEAYSSTDTDVSGTVTYPPLFVIAPSYVEEDGQLSTAVSYSDFCLCAVYGNCAFLHTHHKFEVVCM